MLFTTTFFAQQVKVDKITHNNTRVELQIIPQNIGLVTNVDLSFEVLSYVFTSLDSVVTKFNYGTETYNYDLSQHVSKQKGYFNYCWNGSGEQMDTIKVYFKSWKVGTTPLYWQNNSTIQNGIYVYPTIFNDNLISVPPLQRLRGVVYYSSDQINIVPNATLTLYGQWQKYYHYVTVDFANAYFDIYLPPDAYNVKVDAPYTDKNSINSADALEVMKHFVGISTLPNNRLAAGDVNESGFINTSDALAISRYYVGFPVFTPEWYLNFNQQLLLNDYPMWQNFYSVLIGDANGSWILNNNKTTSIKLEDKDIQYVNSNSFDIPIRVSEPSDVASISLTFTLPLNMEILDVEINNPNSNTLSNRNNTGSLIYNVIDGKLKISWFSVNPIYLNTNDVLITLKVKTDGKNTKLKLDPEMSELTDLNLLPINSKLYTPETILYDNSVSIYPNPTQNIVTIEYNGNGEYMNIDLYNSIGSKITNILSDYVNGEYKITYDMSKLNTGVYYYIVNYNNKNDIHRVILR